MLSLTLRRSLRLFLVLVVVGVPFGVLFSFVPESRGKVGVLFAFLLILYFASHRMWPDPESRLYSRRRR